MAERRRVGAQVLDLVLARRCSCCRNAGPALCATCGAAAIGLIEDFGGPRSVVPQPEPPGFPTTVALGPYAGVLACALSAYKDQDRIDLLAPLAGLLAVSVDALAGPGRGVCLVPIPSSRAGVRRRGRDSLRDLGVALAQCREPPTAVVEVLRPARRVADQAGLSAEQRWLNLADAFAIRREMVARVVGRPVVLVDDVVTTGSTLVAAATALRRVGVEPFGAAVVCATQRRGGRLAKTAPLG